MFSLTSITFNQFTDIYGDDTDLEYKASGGLGFGFKGALGLTYGTGKTTFFSEVTFISMSYAPTEARLKKYVENGQNVIDDIPQDQRKILLKKSYTDGEGDTPVQGRRPYAMSSIASQAGIRISLN